MQQKFSLCLLVQSGARKTGPPSPRTT